MKVPEDLYAAIAEGCPQGPKETLGIVDDWFAAHELIDLSEWCPARNVADHVTVFGDDFCTQLGDFCVWPCPVFAAWKEATP